MIYFLSGRTGTLASLQKVKQSLRRLRWHHEHSGGITLGRKKDLQHSHSVSEDLCSFIKGDNLYSGRKSKKHSVPVKKVPCSMIEEIMKMQHGRAEV